MNIDNWLDNRLGPGHHFNSQILYDFNKEVNLEWVEEIEKFEWNRMFDKWKLILFLKSKMGVL